MDKDFATGFKERTKAFSLAVIKLFKELPKTEEARIMGKQLLRSATSVGANYRAACRSRSDNEFYSKMCVIVEEADEVLYWLELLCESSTISKELFSTLHKEASEILAITASSKKTTKERLDKKQFNNSTIQ